MRGEKIKGIEFFCYEKLFVSGWEGKQWAEVKKKRNLSVLAKGEEISKNHQKEELFARCCTSSAGKRFLRRQWE